jgi:hypothetical protein
MIPQFVFDPTKVNFEPGTFDGGYWNSIFSGLGIDTSKPMPWVKPPAPFRSDIESHWKNLGINPDIKGTNRLDELVTILQNNSISDLSKLKIQATPYEQEIHYAGNEENLPSTEIHKGVHGKLLYGDQSFGRLPGIGKDEVIPREFLGSPRKNVYTLASSSAGKRGGVDYNAYTDDEGNIKAIVPEWVGSDSGWSAFLPVLGLLAAPFTGGLSTALGGGLAGTIGANALIQGGIAGLAGQDPLQAAIRGGVTAGIGSLVNPIASSIGADVFNATDSKFLSDIVSGAVKGVPGALMSGDASNLLTGAVTGAVGSQVGEQLGLTPQQGQAVTSVASKLLQGGDLSPADFMRIGTSFAPGSAMPGTTGNEITEGFFEPGGEGFMPTEYLDDAEVDREMQSLLGRYPAPQPPSDWFLGENIASGIPEWDMAAVNAGLPIGNLEQDFFVAQTKEGPRIVDSAGNVGNFVNGEFVVDTGVTPNLSYAATSAPTPAPAPGPSTAPGKALAPKAQSGMDPRLFSFLMGMMNQDEDKPDPYQVAQINARSPFGTIYDQQQDLLGMIGRG